MRKLLNTLFVLSEDSYLSLDGENILIQREGQEAARFPLHTLETILCFSYKGASPGLMGACAARNVSLCFLSPTGRFLARVSGETRGNVLLRKEQYRRSDDPSQSCYLARCFIAGKLYNCRGVLERATRDHALRVDVPALKRVSSQLASALPPVSECTDAERLLGLEGECASRYFDVFDQLILQNKQDFFFQERSRRPPLDRMNALLSFLYTLLAHDCASALEAVGLDPYVGFLHRDKPGRASLSLDLMEELRSILADRFSLTLVNNRLIHSGDFEEQENGAVLLNENGRKAVLAAWQDRKRETISHPFLEEKITWGLVPYVQALLLARHLRGDLDAYPPFLWK